MFVFFSFNKLEGQGCWAQKKKEKKGKKKRGSVTLVVIPVQAFTPLVRERENEK